MREFSFLTYNEAKKHDEFLINQGFHMDHLINIAGQRIAAWIKSKLDNQPLVGIIGKGNNGIDVLEAFAHFPHRRKRYLYLIDNKIKESKQYIELFNKNVITEISEISAIPKKAIILDGIFGTGLNKKLTPDIKKLIIGLNKLPNKIISIDIPSGLSETNDEICIKASVTLSMMFPKKVFLNKTKKEKCGKIYVMNFKLNQSELQNYKFPNYSNAFIKLT